MPTGRVVTPVEKAYITSIQDAASPSKQLELIEKRAAWVFGAVGTVGVALTGFTGSRRIAHDHRRPALARFPDRRADPCCCDSRCMDPDDQGRNAQSKRHWPS